MLMVAENYICKYIGKVKPLYIVASTANISLEFLYGTVFRSTYLIYPHVTFSKICISMAMK